MNSGLAQSEQDHIDEDEERWLEELAQQCLCCPVCWSVPCDGCLQGAYCDEMVCHYAHDH